MTEIDQAGEPAPQPGGKLALKIRADIDEAVKAFAPLVAAVNQVGAAFLKIAKANHPWMAVVQYGDDYRRHRRKCRLCNPAGNPKPLRVNGADYRRRTRSRKHRNRR